MYVFVNSFSVIDCEHIVHILRIEHCHCSVLYFYLLFCYGVLCYDLFYYSDMPMPNPFAVCQIVFLKLEYKENI